MRKGIVVVCLLLLVCSVALCACDGNVLEEDAELVELSTWFFTSGVPNNLIKMKHSDPNAVFQLTADEGEFYEGGGEWSQTVTRNNGELATWQNFESIDCAYVDVIVTVDDNIVGYAVIKITYTTVYLPQYEAETKEYGAEVIKSVVFPKMNGEYQKITQKQVESKIQAAKY